MFLSHCSAFGHLEVKKEKKKGEDGRFLGRNAVDAEDMAVPHRRPHHDPSHVWLLIGHL